MTASSSSSSAPEVVVGEVDASGTSISCARSSKLTRTDFFLLPLSKPSCERTPSDVSLGGLTVLALAAVPGEKFATGDAVRTDEDGLSLSADFAGDTDLGGGI
jgi:hypothetical protein